MKNHAAKNQSVSVALTRLWNRYRSAVKASRKAVTPENVHALRVATQRLEAVLEIFGKLPQDRHTQILVDSMKTTRKCLGDLRDLQLISESKKVGSKRFSSFIDQEEERARKKALKRLDSISLKDEKKLLDRLLSDSLAKLENEKSEKQLHGLFDPVAEETLLSLNAALAKTTRSDMKNLHHVRILAKRLRYQEEALKKIFGKTRFSLEKLKSAQTSIGKIQDSNALLEKLDRYLKKGPGKSDHRLIAKRNRMKKRHEIDVETEFKNLSSAQWEK